MWSRRFSPVASSEALNVGYFLSAATDAFIVQIVDPNYTVLVKIAKSRLPNSPRSLIHQRILDAVLSRAAMLARAHLILYPTEELLLEALAYRLARALG